MTLDTWQRDLKRFIPPSVMERLLNISEPIEEIRIRAERPVQVVFSDGDLLLPEQSSLAQCQHLLEAMCDYSVYARDEELRGCFLTLRGGYRVGLSGRVTVENGIIRRLSFVSGFNIRIARACENCASALMALLTEQGMPQSALLISAPGVGKTTVLRDVARQFSYGCESIPARRVSIADERGEIAASYQGVPLLDVGPRTDVLDCCPKEIAIPLLLRSMSPEVIITDEIGGRNDAACVLDAARAGVAVVASAHAGSFDSLKEREAMRPLLSCFHRIILLTRTKRNMLYQVASENSDCA